MTVHEAVFEKTCENRFHSCKLITFTSLDLAQFCVHPYSQSMSNKIQSNGAYLPETTIAANITERSFWFCEKMAPRPRLDVMIAR